MEEFQEADVLWPGRSGGQHQERNNNDNSVIGDGDATIITTAPSSVRSAPVEISRRKRRCRPWAASEHRTFDEITGDDDDDATKRATTTTTDDGPTPVVPPHVLVARRRGLGRSRTAAYSMCAGKGRTLKGRDLRDVRNRVLQMTGFIEK